MVTEYPTERARLAIEENRAGEHLACPPETECMCGHQAYIHEDSIDAPCLADRCPCGSFCEGE